MKLSELAALIGGEVRGDGEVTVGAVKGIDEAAEGDLTFVANARYKKKLAATAASAVIVGPDTEAQGKNLLIVPDPYAALGKVLAVLHPEEEMRPRPVGREGVEEGAVVSPEAVLYPGAYVCRGARIEAGVVLHPGVFVGRDVSIGEGSVLHPNVTVYRRCLIGRRVILHAGVVVGSDGFGFARPGRENLKIPQVGYVQIDDDVEIGANTTIDRGTLGRTWIQRGVKIDNLVQIGHNVVVGEYSVIVAQVGISGSTRLGRGVVVGGQAGVVGHIALGDRVMVAARAGVHKDVPAGEVVAGTPHLPHREWLKMEACLPKVPKMREALAALEKRLAALEKKGEKERS